MLDDIMQTMRGFVDLFRLRSSQPWALMLPLMAMALAWAMLRTYGLAEREAFMAAFVIAIGLQVVTRAEGAITTLRNMISSRQALTLAVLIAPTALAVLIWSDEPLWCERFLSLYFGVNACLYLLDLIDGRHLMVRHVLPSNRPRGADPMMSRVLAICYLALVLLNETMIQQAGLAVWLVYFSFLPSLQQRLILALVRTVDEAYAKGFGQS